MHAHVHVHAHVEKRSSSKNESDGVGEELIKAPTTRVRALLTDNILTYCVVLVKMRTPLIRRSRLTRVIKVARRVGKFAMSDDCPSITCASIPHAPSSADDPLWMLAEPAVISHFHSASSGHRPATECRALLRRKQARCQADFGRSLGQPEA